MLVGWIGLFHSWYSSGQPAIFILLWYRHSPYGSCDCQHTAASSSTWLMRKGINNTNDKECAYSRLIWEYVMVYPPNCPKTNIICLAREGAEMAEDIGCSFLGQILSYQSICENGDMATPAALDETTITDVLSWNRREMQETDREKRNAGHPPYCPLEKKVTMHWTLQENIYAGGKAYGQHSPVYFHFIFF